HISSPDHSAAGSDRAREKRLLCAEQPDERGLHRHSPAPRRTDGEGIHRRSQTVKPPLYFQTKTVTRIFILRTVLFMQSFSFSLQGAPSIPESRLPAALL